MSLRPSFRLAVILTTVLFFAAGACPQSAHQLIIATGYANSGTPETGSDISESNPPFRAGGGYAFEVRMDLAKPGLWFGPSFIFWNNLTGDPSPNSNASYFQIELGGKLFLRTHTIPAIYGGIGAGYSVSHGEDIPIVGYRREFDGDFPTGSIHFGVKTPTRTTGLGLLAEASYHFGLDKPTGRMAVGPAKAFLIQIGIAMDARLGGD